MKLLRNILILVFAFYHMMDCAELPIKKVIIWGYKLHSHTHSYIHDGYYKAFKFLGYDTYWFDERDNIRGFDFSDSLFLTEGNCDTGIPIRDDCFYVVHCSKSEKYGKLSRLGRFVDLKVYWNILKNNEMTYVDDFTFYNLKKRVLCMPWATDLLPYEIDEVKKQMPIACKPYSYFIGSRHGDVNDTTNVFNSFGRACAENKIRFIVTGLYSAGAGVSSDNHKQLIESSILAPALQGKLQVDNGYIPCRIFKNISYGQLGVTNSRTVYEFFKRKIVYNPDPYRLCYDALDCLKTITFDEIYEMMDFVRDNHTYLNRINTLFDFIQQVYQSCQH